MLPVGSRIECDFTDGLYVGTVLRHKGGAMVTRFDADGEEVALRPRRHRFREVRAEAATAKRKAIVGGSISERANVGAASATSSGRAAARSRSAAAEEHRFAVGDLVDVDRRLAKDGGLGKIAAVSEGGELFTIKYLMGGTEKKVRRMLCITCYGLRAR
jgi:hypothetical protein